MFYLTAKHRAQLKAEHGVESWHFEQGADEGVFIPAGCPHQVQGVPCQKGCAVGSLEQGFSCTRQALLLHALLTEV